MRGKTRERAGDQVLISFRLASDWFRAWRQFLHQSQTEAKRNQNKSRLLSTINWKLLWPVLYVNILTLTEPKWQKNLREVKIISLQNHTICTLVIFRVGRIRWKTRRGGPLVFLFGRWFWLGGAHLWEKKKIKKAISANTYLGKYGGRTGK